MNSESSDADCKLRFTRRHYATSLGHMMTSNRHTWRTCCVFNQKLNLERLFHQPHQVRPLKGLKRPGWTTAKAFKTHATAVVRLSKTLRWRLVIVFHRRLAACGHSSLRPPLLLTRIIRIVKNTAAGCLSSAARQMETTWTVWQVRARVSFPFVETFRCRLYSNHSKAPSTKRCVLPPSTPT